MHPATGHLFKSLEVERFNALMRLSHKKEFLRFAPSDPLLRAVHKLVKNFGKLQSYYVTSVK